MIVAGIDIGSRATKSVVMKDNKILSTAIIDTGPESVKTSYLSMETVLKGTGLKLEDLEYVVATGYGRVLVPFAKENISEISCHARGINWYFPSVRTILDMGGQDCKAINCDAAGQVTNFIMNDKCAGGTGRFLEMIADVLNLPLNKIGEVSLQSTKKVDFNTICAVFAKTDAIGYLRQGVERADILAGLHEAIATRCHNLLKRVTIQQDFSITGGISKNKGMVAKIKERMGMEPLLCEDPQLVGALGAAIFAGEKLNGSRIKEMRVQYGYDDATGAYFITVDNALCDGCGQCVSACPAGLWEVAPDDNSRPKARIKEASRKRLSYACPGFKACSAANATNCHSACPRAAVSHSW